MSNQISVRAFHAELLELFRLIRDGIVKLSDIAFASYMNRSILDVFAERLLDSSLENEWRKIASHYRAASKSLEYLRFVRDWEYKSWKCMACPATPEQAEIMSLKLLGDACMSDYRNANNGSAKRPVHLVYQEANGAGLRPCL